MVFVLHTEIAMTETVHLIISFRAPRQYYAELQILYLNHTYVLHIYPENAIDGKIVCGPNNTVVKSRNFLLGIALVKVMIVHQPNGLVHHSCCPCIEGWQIRF